MNPDTPSLNTPRRGRVLMLVDNGVNGDSRVQKTARSAAERGWEVTLLGRSPTNQVQEWKLGDAQVRLIPMGRSLGRRRHEFRRAWIRYPLAYPPNGVHAHRNATVVAWRMRLNQRAAELRVAQNGGAPIDRWAWRRIRVQRMAMRSYAKWVWLRGGMARRAKDRRTLGGPWDRLYTVFWQKVLGDAAWRKLEPQLLDFERSFGPVIDTMRPDIIHANDFRMLGVAARAKVRAKANGRDVKLVWDAHEYLPGVKPWQNSARWTPGNLAHERESAPYADAVITVSPTLSDMLQHDYQLAETPAVVLNAPAAEHAPAGESTPDLRRDCGVGPDTPLVVYSGAGAVQRGLGTMVEALPQLPGVHTVFVVNNRESRLIQGYVARAKELGAADRLHLVPYVAHWHVVPYLAGADVGVIPIHHWPNHEIALITKFFEYSNARLPMVVSDVKTMSETVRATGQGEVFVAEDVADYVRAVQAVLADPQRYRSAYDTPGLLAAWTWEAQVDVLDEVYTKVLGGAAG